MPSLVEMAGEEPHAGQSLCLELVPHPRRRRVAGGRRPYEQLYGHPAWGALSEVLSVHRQLPPGVGLGLHPPHTLTLKHGHGLVVAHDGYVDDGFHQPRLVKPGLVSSPSTVGGNRMSGGKHVKGVLRRPQARGLVAGSAVHTLERCAGTRWEMKPDGFTWQHRKPAEGNERMKG